MNVRAKQLRNRKGRVSVVHMSGKDYPFFYRAYCGQMFGSFEVTSDQATCDKCLSRLLKGWVL